MRRSKPVIKAATSVSVLLAMALLGGQAVAEDQPGRGLQMLEKEQKAPVIQQEISKPSPPKAEPGKKVLITKFRFEGNTLFSDQELEAAVAQAEGKELSLEDLKTVADVITGKYRDAGYLIAYAYLPPQTVSGGVVVIRVVEGKVGDIIVTGNKSYSSSFIKRYFSKVKKDPTLEEDTLERQLLLLNDYPSLTVKAALKAGQQPGTTDLIASVSDSFPISGSVSYDNFGVRTTSKNRLNATLDVGNLVTSGDLLMLRGTMGLDHVDLDHLAYGRVEYMVPVGGYGTQIGAYYTNTVYAAGETLAPLEISGNANIGGVWVTHPVVRQRDTTLSARLGWEYAHIRDNLLGMKNHQDDIRKLSLSFAYDLTDRYLGRNFVGFGYSRGLGDMFGGDGVSSVLNSRSGADDNFNKLNLDVMRIQKLPGYSHLVLRGSGQYSPDRIFVAEEFIVGGEGTVRGFDPATIAGDSGLFASVEVAASPLFPEKTLFGQKVGDTFKFAAFTDYGRVFINHRLPTEEWSNDLFSVGIGARLYVTKYFSGLFDWAVPSYQGNLSTKHSKAYFQARFSF